MKQIYCCELCGEPYATQEECEKCEQFHIEPQGLDAGMFVPIAKASTPYIEKIIVRMKDGKCAQYLFDKVVENVEKVPHPSISGKEGDTK